MAAIASQNLAGKPTGSAAVLTLIFFIFIPWEAGILRPARREFPTPDGPKGCAALPLRCSRRGAAREKVSGCSPIGCGAALIAP